MARVTFLGGDETILGNIGFIRWPIGTPGSMTDLILPLNKAVEVKNEHVLNKLRGMRDSGYFLIEEDLNDAPKELARGASGEHGGVVEESVGTLKAGAGRTPQGVARK